MHRLDLRGEAAEMLGVLTLGLNEEILPPSELSAVHLAEALAVTEDGLFYPIGGEAALKSSFTRTIQRSGGTVVTDAAIGGLVLESAGNSKGGKLWSCKGVQVALPSSGNGVGEEEVVVSAGRSVISGLGVLLTYTKLIPHHLVSNNARSALSQLSESRPKVLVLFWISGSRESLGLQSCDLVEVPSRKEKVEAAADSTEDLEEFLDGWVRIWSPSAKDPTWMSR